MIAIGGLFKFLALLDCHSSLFHQAAGTMPAHIQALLTKLPGHAPGTITCPRCIMDLPDFGHQEKIRINPLYSSTSEITVISTPANFHHRTQNGDGKGLLLLPDKVVSYLDSLAKKAAAFFNMSRSI